MIIVTILAGCQKYQNIHVNNNIMINSKIVEEKFKGVELVKNPNNIYSFYFPNTDKTLSLSYVMHSPNEISNYLKNNIFSSHFYTTYAEEMIHVFTLSLQRVAKVYMKTEIIIPLTWDREELMNITEQLKDIKKK